MATRVDIEEIEATKSEKFLAIVLAVFLLMGTIWAYQEIDDAIHGPPDAEATYLTVQEQAALSRLEQADMRLQQAQAAQSAARDTLELAREEYRAALDEGREAPRLERAYRNAQREFAQASDDVAAARADVAEAMPAGEAARRKLAGEVEERFEYEGLVIFALRSVLVAAILTAGLVMLTRLRRRGSRYLPVAFAVVGAATVLAFVLASDYVTDYVDPLDLGPLVLSLFGIAVTLLAFWWLQRFLARRLPFRRVRKRECPFCGFPATGTPRCEGCGREVVASCATCGEARRVGTAFCGACGNA